tara:strand:+ start:28157 stop:29302 length:1146 start_codon:yes stop_codon:yes gene_type:complete
MKVKSAKDRSILIYAESDSNADQLYFGGVFVPDPFISFSRNSEKYAVVSALEYARVREESDFDEVLALEEWMTRARKQFRREQCGVAEIIRLLAREFGISSFHIAEDFPAGLAFRLRSAGMRLIVSEGPLFPEREIKSDLEASAIRKGNQASASGIRVAERMLRQSVVKNGRIYSSGRLLTSERLQEAIEIACIEKGAVASGTIVAGGDQGCDPHCRGSGPLWPNELIIIDVFPRVKNSGYYGDMTRTFLKGRPSDRQRELVSCVKEAQTLALKSLKPGIAGSKVHSLVQNHFERKGFNTGKKGGVNEGFFHGTGHGLGLEVHELPRAGRQGEKLRTGSVVTIEPGLYYRGLGGCRIEDVARLRTGGSELLSKYHYRWVIR